MPGIGAWENKPPNELLLIAIPHTGMAVFDWAVGFKILQPPVNFNIITQRGLPIDRARCDLVKQARTMGASHIFFLDSDVIVPPDGLIRLWNHRLPIIAGVYGAKHECPDVWLEQKKSGEGRYAPVMPQTLEQYPLFSHKDIVTGAGCLLVEMSIFDKLKEPYFLWTQGREPDGISEDFYFFEKCREAGIPVHIDTMVRCRHLEFSMLEWTGERKRLQI